MHGQLLLPGKRIIVDPVENRKDFLVLVENQNINL
jgi:hypothetical protein